MQPGFSAPQTCALPTPKVPTGHSVLSAGALPFFPKARSETPCFPPPEGTMSSRLAFPGCILGRGYSSCAGDQPSQPKPHLGLPPFGRHKEEMVPSGNRQADIIQAGSRKQKGGEGLLRVVLVQSLVDEADRKDLWERESEVGGGPRLTAEGWGCPVGPSSPCPGLHSRSVSSWTWALTWLTAACRSFQLRKAPSTPRICRSFTRASKYLAAR